MIKIGILAPGNSDEIIDSLVNMLKKCKKMVAVKQNSRRINNDIRLYEKTGIEYVFIEFGNKRIYPVDIDIMILDNARNDNIVSYDLIKCISDNTVLIYNTDSGYLPYIDHPNAIDYGFGINSCVGISSISYSDNKISVIVSIQRPFIGLFFNKIDVCEFSVEVFAINKTVNIIPGIIILLLCDLFSCSNVKFSINSCVQEYNSL